MGLNYLGNFVLQSNILPTLSDGQGQSPPSRGCKPIADLVSCIDFQLPIKPHCPTSPTARYHRISLLSKEKPEQLDYLKGGSTKEAMFNRRLEFRAIFKGA